LRLLRFPKVNDARGSLTEFDYSTLPFIPRRSFVISNVPPGTARGRHAHRKCEHVLVCLHGQVTINATFEDEAGTFVLNDPGAGLFIGAGVWAEQTYDVENTVLLVFASLPYADSSYFEPDWIAGAR
jgi:dTDP-4-dehydrorhamnose 3,5-epimerase-like enzyme